MIRVAKDVRVRLNLAYDPEVFSIGEDHFVLWVSSNGDCASILDDGLWFISGQLMALAPWKSDFVPGKKPISMTVV